MMRRLVLLALLLCGARAHAGSTTFLWSPAPALVGGSEAVVGNATLPTCIAWVPVLSITAATSINFYVTVPLASGKQCSVSIYSANGATRLGTTGAVACDSIGAKGTSGLSAFSLTAGVKYHVCTCVNAGGLELLGNADDGGLRALTNTLSVPYRFQGSNACGGDGSAPSSLGTFTGLDGRSVYVLLGTNTP